MQIPVPYLTTPADVCNQALDKLGEPSKIIGDINDGTIVAEAARRNYGRLLRQLLRTAHWNFARKQATLTLLGDATGQSSLPVITSVEPPWTYAYAWPIDGVQGRWMPYQTVAPPGTPLTTGIGTLPQIPMIPGRFLVSSSALYPIEIGVQPWTNQPDLQRTEGLGPINRKVILTDICQANFVYTRLVTVIEEWDDLFREAMVTLMALALAPTAVEDPKERLAQRNLLIPIVKNIIADARVANGNEAGMSQSVDHTPRWISARGGYGIGGALGGGSLGGAGVYLPWEQFSLGGGSVF